MTAARPEIDRLALLVQATLAELGGRATFGLQQARRLAGRAEERARDFGLPVVIAVADAAGSLLLLHRMDGALPASTDIAIHKAFTAAAFRLATHELGRLAQPGQPLYGIETTNHGRVVLFGGGYPCRSDGTVVGAIGISGGTVDQDMQIAEHALRSVSEHSGIRPEGEDHDE